MRRWLPFLVPFGVVAGAGLAVRLIFWWNETAPCETWRPVTFDALPYEEGCFELSGTAHYPVVVKQTVPGNVLVDPQTWYLFPLFPDGATADRAVRVLVRTRREPEHLVSYEGMAVRGRLLHPTPERLPYSTEIELGKRSDYFFTDGVLLLEPEEIEADGEVWRSRR